MDVTQQKNLSLKQYFGYSFYSFASFFGMITFAFLNYFYPVIGMNYVLFSTALLVARILDFILTLFVGGIMEKVPLKLGGGKYRPWLFISQFTIYAGMVLLFSDPVPGNDVVHFIIVVVGSILVNTTMSFIITAQFGIVPQMAGASVTDRVNLTTWNYRFMVLGQVGTSALGAYVLAWIGMVIAPPLNYTVMTAAFALFYFLGIGVLRATAKPYDKRVEGMPGMPTVKVSDMVKAVATNSQLLIYLLAQTLMFTGLMAMMNIMIYYYQIIVPFTHEGITVQDGFPGLFTIGMTATSVASFIFALFAPILGNKLGKVRAMWIGCLIAALSGVLNFFFGASWWVLYIGISFLGTFSAALYSGFGVNYALDCGEYGLWKTGQDHRLVIMSMTNMPMKIAAIVGGLILYALAFIGYDSMAVSIAADQNVLPAFASDSFVTGYMFCLGMVPAIFNTLAALLMAFAYKIKDADAARYAAENMERMGGMGMMPPMGPPPEDAPPMEA
ncbi:MAG: MFS transporter [Coriobacteriales bacterium]|jgi:Na+/melibiose symporter-like transporter|nr:MFS transporter [Coriobacteriales bacterium]